MVMVGRILSETETMQRRDIIIVVTRRVLVQRGAAVERDEIPYRESPYRDAASPIKYNGLRVRPAAVSNLLSPIVI